MPDFSKETSKASKAFEDCDTKEFAFHSLGVDYYKHTHRGFNMTYSKWFELSTMSEFHDKWKLTAIDVDEFFRVERDSWATIRAMVAGGQQEEALEFIDEAMTYNSLVSIRRLAKHPEALYREASVFFFDQTEDPARYDELYAEEKIKRWIQDPELINNKELFFRQSVLCCHRTRCRCLRRNSNRRYSSSETWCRREQPQAYWPPRKRRCLAG
ncbi:hypothetical protein BWI93_05370 [Siphonobacter sp. BAB-5385]|uniref:hypothetical protein n=1 Tax=Siphonobacter sp. BAB-5385 TaxID=1864822 RepID=UPI000B9E6DE6|nr:hypothetical protein [Siphonobacter sp. BAB-5385]OZI09177.1 hypothetical protein BWI93_05370 [Siphonobacter sp. BAB-5385]